MLDWIFEGIVKWAAGIASELMDTVGLLIIIVLIRCELASMG